MCICSTFYYNIFVSTNNFSLHSNHSIIETGYKPFPHKSQTSIFSTSQTLQWRWLIDQIQHLKISNGRCKHNLKWYSLLIVIRNILRTTTLPKIKCVFLDMFKRFNASVQPSALFWSDSSSYGSITAYLLFFLSKWLAGSDAHSRRVLIFK